MAYTESSFSVDDFKNPKVYKNPEAIMTLLVRLLILEPGTFQSHPEMGVGLYSKYAYGVEITSDELLADFKYQIGKYLPQFQGVKLRAGEESGVLAISCEIDDVLYGIYYDSQKSAINSTYTPIANL